MTHRMRITCLSASMTAAYLLLVALVMALPLAVLGTGTAALASGLVAATLLTWRVFYVLADWAESA